ncbi:hypothetical protein F4859DRAFT_508390 [Xylaria cf. heliscus]|nr:hypothetical protein F4859DRAFT_508390 [Xylaria cf. heliscus]
MATQSDAANLDAKTDREDDDISAQSHAEETASSQALSEAKYLRIYWHDYTSLPKCRVIPIDRVRAAEKPFTITITKASLGLLPNDTTIPGVTGTGVYTLKPDWSSLRRGPAPGHVSCQAFFHEEDGPASPLCPRGILHRALRHASRTAGLTFLVGFEVEFTVLGRAGDDDPSDKDPVFNNGHSWSTARALASWGAEDSFATAADEILDALRAARIVVEQFHAEGAPGQFELVLAPQTPLQACDALLHARQVIEGAAARRGFRVTLHPRPFPFTLGSGSHAHISISSARGDDRAVYERFYGGILAHFRAVFALTNAHPASYERMVDGLWAGGRWVTWGTHNKETPLRKCRDSHWEVKVMDGMANPYLAVAGLVYAGTAGAAFTWGDCAVDPAKLSGEERKALGIEEKFPGNLPEALVALQEDETMVELLGREFVERYVGVKKGEMKLLESIPEQMRRQWIMEKY